MREVAYAFNSLMDCVRVSLRYRDPRLATVASHTPYKITFWILVWLSLFSTAAYAQASQNVTIPLSSDRIVYTPFVCDTSDVVGSPEACAGAWFSTNIADSPLPVMVSLGRNASAGNILPQMFFRFRASTLYLNFVPGFNASINLTLSSTNNLAITRTVQSSIGFATVVNIPEDLITTLTITVLPTQAPIQFGLLSLMITVPLNAESTSILPSLTLPSPSPISTWFSPTTTSFATSTITMVSEPPKNTIMAHAVGITVGLGLGLTSLMSFTFFLWKRRRRKLDTAAAPTQPEGVRQTTQV